MENKHFIFGNHWSFNLRSDAKRLAFVLSRYSVAAQFSQQKGSILELGCSEGIGVPILTQNSEAYLGIDLDKSAVDSAKHNFPEMDCEFRNDDFMGKNYGKFDTVVSLDVVEHIYPDHEALFFETAYNNLSPNGICVIGTPNITSSQYASEQSNRGHVNLFSQDRLSQTLYNYFNFVLPFSMNDEVVHTGYAPMSHYLINVAFGKKPL